MDELDLPMGVREEDLRFINPNIFSIYMGMRGWSVELEFDVDDNPAKSSIVLSRPIADDFSVEDFDSLVERMDIAGEETGTYKPGYSLIIDSFNEVPLKTAEMRKIINPHESTDRTLIFNFRGFSTEETMDALEAITAIFEEKDAHHKRRRLLKRVLGRFSIGSKD